MDIKRSISKLTQQQMSRKEFLRNVSAAALTLAGVTAAVKALGGQHGQANSSYGASTYGGQGADRS